MPVQHATAARRITTLRRTAAAKPAAAEASTRVVRRTRAASPASPSDEAIAEIGNRLQLIADVDAELREATTRREILVAEIAKLIHDGKISGEVINHGYRAVIEDTMSRASTDIDVIDLFNYLKKMGKQDEFWGLVKVQIGEVKKVLSDREYAKLPKEETAAAKTGSKITVEPVKVKGRK